MNRISQVETAHPRHLWFSFHADLRGWEKKRVPPSCELLYLNGNATGKSARSFGRVCVRLAFLPVQGACPLLILLFVQVPQLSSACVHACGEVTPIRANRQRARVGGQRQKQVRRARVVQTGGAEFRGKPERPGI